MPEEVARVLKSERRATFIVGNSCLKGVFIKNSDAVEAVAQMADLNLFFWSVIFDVLLVLLFLRAQLPDILPLSVLVIC